MNFTHFCLDMQLNNIDSTKKWADFSKIICKWAYFYSTIFICAIEEELKPFPQNEIRQNENHNKLWHKYIVQVPNLWHIVLFPTKNYTA